MHGCVGEDAEALEKGRARHVGYDAEARRAPSRVPLNLGSSQRFFAPGLPHCQTLYQKSRGCADRFWARIRMTQYALQRGPTDPLPPPTCRRPFVVVYYNPRMASKGFRPRSLWSSIPHMGEDRTRDSSNTKPGRSKKPADGYMVTVEEAAKRLNVKEDTIRKRVQRGKMLSRKGRGGRMEVILSPEEYYSSSEDKSKTVQDDTGQAPDRTEALIEALSNQVDDLRNQLRAERQAHAEARRIMAGLVERIPAIEAPQEATEAAETVEQEQPEGAEPRSTTGGTQEPVQRPWWRRIFGR